MPILRLMVTERRLLDREGLAAGRPMVISGVRVEVEGVVVSFLFLCPPWAFRVVAASRDAAEVEAGDAAGVEGEEEGMMAWEVLSL